MKYGKYLMGIALLLAVSSANSATFALLPESLFAQPDSEVSFDLFIDFGGSTTHSGAVDIASDSDKLTFVSFVWDSSFPNTDIKLVDPRSPRLVSVGFGNFLAPITGTFNVGEVKFKLAADAADGLITHLTLGPSAMWGGFDGLTPPVQYFGATITTAVPLPPTAWLFASGLAVLGMFRLRRQLGAVQAETGGSFA